MGQVAQIEIPMLLAKRIQARAVESDLPVGYLVELYLNHCVLKHKDILNFEFNVQKGHLLPERKKK